MRFQTHTVITSSTSEVVARPAEDVGQFVSDIIVASPSATSLSIKDGTGVTICRIAAPGSHAFRTPLMVSPGRAIVVQAGDSLASVSVTLLGEIRKEVTA